MLKIFHEAPKSIFKDVQEYTDGDYALVNLFNDEEYYQQFAEAVSQGREVILDNGVFELGKAFDSDVFASWVERLKPAYYIVPDVLEDGEATVDRFFNFIRDYKLPGKVLGVAQGRDYDDFIKCYKAIEPYCDKVGISFDYSWYRETSMALSPWVQLARGRYRTLLRMQEDGVLNKSKPHHLLGVAVPQEMKYYRTDGADRWIESVDTSNPVVHGLKGVLYSSLGLFQKDTQKLYTLVNAEVSPKQRKDILFNISRFRRFCNE